MIKGASDYAGIKTAVGKMYNKPVSVTENLGRNKFKSYDGVVTGVYAALFTVKPNAAYNGKTSFSYAEVACGNVRLKEI